MIINFEKNKFENINYEAHLISHSKLFNSMYKEELKILNIN